MGLLLSAVGSSSVYSEGIEEIVVTAQKREQTLQEVPVAVSVFTPEQMKQTGTVDIRGLVDFTPGFSGNTEDSFIDALAIRGIVTNDFGIGGDPSIAVFTDGVWAGRNGGVQTAFYDMERAEVVKGPQTTLFGRNAIAGGINILTKKPVNEFEGSFGGTIAQYDELSVTGTVNVPLNDQWAVRASTYLSDSGGYIENVAGGGDLGGGKISSTRLVLGYDTDKMQAVFRTTYEDREQDPSIYWSEQNGISKDKVSTDLLDGQGVDEGEIFSIQANIDRELTDTTSLSSITGYKTYNFTYLEDYDGTPLFVNNYFQDQEVDFFSQEFRLNFDNGAWSGFIGGSFYQEDIDATFINSYNEDDLCIAVINTDDAGGALGCDDPVFEAYWEDDIDPADILAYKAETNINKLKAKGSSIFGDITWSLNEKTEVTLGGRYSVDEKDMSIAVLDGGGALGNTFNWEFYTNGFVQDKNKWSKFTPRIAMNYLMNDKVSFYANIAKGYKTGGYSTFGIVHDETTDFGGQLPDTAKPLSFEPEENTNFEVGTKTVLLDNTLRFNASLFRYNYKDLQLVIFEGGSQLVKNLGEAKNTGLELDGHWVPNDNWEFRGTLALQNSEITKEIEAGDGSIGNSLPVAPETSGSLIATYSHPVTNGSMFYTAQSVFQSEVFGGTGNNQLAKVDSWNELALRMGYKSDNDWSLTLWAENVTDEVYFERGWENADADDTAGFGLVNTTTWPSKPRTIGLSFDKSF